MGDHPPNLLHDFTRNPAVAQLGKCLIFKLDMWPIILDSEPPYQLPDVLSRSTYRIGFSTGLRHGTMQTDDVTLQRRTDRIQPPRNGRSLQMGVQLSMREL